MTGDLGPKLFDLLHSVVPELRRVAVLVTSNSTTYREILEGVQAGARRAGVKALVFEASTPQEVENALCMLSWENVEAVIVGASSFFAQQRNPLSRRRRASYSITRSARRRSGGGNVRPRASADFAFRTNSNVFACSIGKSPGRAPRRMRST